MWVLAIAAALLAWSSVHYCCDTTPDQISDYACFLGGLTFLYYHLSLRKTVRTLEYVALLVLLCYAIWRFSMPELLVLFVVGALAFWYYNPYIRENWRLRKFPWLKSLVIALVWSVMTMVFPMYLQYKTLDTQLWLLGLERLLFIFVASLQSDVIDLEADHREGIRTLPMILGRRGTNLVSILLLFTLLVLQGYLAISFYISSSLVFAQVITYFLFLDYVLWSKKRQKL